MNPYELYKLTAEQEGLSLKDVNPTLAALVEMADATRNPESSTNIPDALQPATDTDSLILSPETKQLADKLQLHQQYTTQMDVLVRTGVAEFLGPDQVVITDINGTEQLAPTYAEVLASLEANREIVTEKATQGFTQLLMVPFGMPLARLAEAYGKKLIEVHAAGNLLSSDGTELDLDTDTPVWLTDAWKNAADVEGRIVYYPTSFSKEKHGGKTKSDLLTAPKSSWEIQLVEDMVDIPAAGEATITAGRTRPMAGKSPVEYLLDIQAYLASGQYAHESGLTPEAWLTLALTRLCTRWQVIDDWQGSGKIDYLLGAFNPTTGYLPLGCWSRGRCQASLDSIYPDYAFDYDGFRPSVRLKT